MVNRMTIRTKEFEIEDAVVSPVSIYMMEFQNFRNFFPTASTASADFKQIRFSYSGVNKNSTIDTLYSVTSMHAPSRTIKSMALIRNEGLSASFTASGFDRFTRAFFRAKSLVHMSCITPESSTTAFAGSNHV